MLDDATWSAVFTPGDSEEYFQGPAVFGELAFDVDNKHQLAWLFSECSRLAYNTNAHARQSALDQIECSEHYWCEVEDLAAGIWMHQENCILAFRGTNQPKNWLRNIDALLEQFDNYGKVHSGFLAAFDLCWQHLRRHMPTYKQLICCGHSLGGAMASIAALTCKANALFTFGSPRVGDETFSQQFEHIFHLRCCNRDDIVTHLPPSKDRFIYKHIGEALWLGTEERKRDRFKERLKDPTLWFSTPKHLSDHAPINYSQRLAVLAENKIDS